MKKSSSRKGRYLLAFNFQLAPAAAGKLVRALQVLCGLRSAHAACVLFQAAFDACVRCACRASGGHRRACYL